MTSFRDNPFPSARLYRGGGGLWTAKTVKRPRQQPTHPQYANYWAPLTRKRHTMPHPAQSQHTKYWAPRTRKRHQQEHRPQRPTESSDPTQHAKGRTGDRPGPRKGATTRRTVTQGGLEGEKIHLDKFGSPPSYQICPSISRILCGKMCAPHLCVVTHCIISCASCAQQAVHDFPFKAAMCQEASSNHPEPTR